MKSHFLSTERYLGTLAADLGSFPFDNEAYPPLSHWLIEGMSSIQSLLRFGTDFSARTETVLYP